MAEDLVIDCIGEHVLNIIIAGACHSVLLATNRIRISGPGYGLPYGLDELPVSFNMAELRGRLTISDEDGEMIYSWRAAPPRSTHIVDLETDATSCLDKTNESTANEEQSRKEGVSQPVDKSAVVKPNKSTSNHDRAGTANNKDGRPQDEDVIVVSTAQKKRPNSDGNAEEEKRYVLGRVCVKFH